MWTILFPAKVDSDIIIIAINTYQTKSLLETKEKSYGALTLCVFCQKLKT